MCGILFTDNPAIGENTFLNALDLMRHRGPDAQGYYAHGNFKLGHNLLKVSDSQEQPFRSSDGRYVIICDGRIYNRRELTKEYGILTKTNSDAETLLELYVCLGPKMLDLLNGMFTFIILDTRTKELFAVRDRLGIKPLYFSRLGKGITFASEMAPMLELIGKPPLNDTGLRQYLKLRTFFNGQTIYSGIEMFPAGHYWLSGKIRRYWELPAGEKPPPEDGELRELITSAVDYRCLSDVPVGSYLSGGLDSTIVAQLADAPHTWTVGFADCNEFEWARLASDYQNSIHTEVLIDRNEFLALAEQLTRQRREPLSVPNEVLLYKMTRQAKAKNTVILSGEGADELFFGYDRIFRWAATNEWNLAEFSRRYAYGSHQDLEIVEDAVSPFLHYGRAVDIVAAFFQVAHLHGLLRRLDFATMRNAVEARAPFVDHRLVERMAGVPFDQRLVDGVVKAPLKRIFRERTPAEIIAREKVGFPVPLESLPFEPRPGANPMDAWLQFNLNALP